MGYDNVTSSMIGTATTLGGLTTAMYVWLQGRRVVQNKILAPLSILGVASTLFVVAPVSNQLWTEVIAKPIRNGSTKSETVAGLQGMGVGFIASVGAVVPVFISIAGLNKAAMRAVLNPPQLKPLWALPIVANTAIGWFMATQELDAVTRRKADGTLRH
eukprot:Colp12_sorted_trinity150504_noHs@27410